MKPVITAFVALSWVSLSCFCVSAQAAQNTNSSLVAYSKGVGVNSGLVLAQNKSGEQIILTLSRDLGLFPKDIRGNAVETTDWFVPSLPREEEKFSSVGRVLSTRQGQLSYQRTVNFYRPRPQYLANKEATSQLLPERDFALLFNSGRDELSRERLERGLHNKFERVLEFGEAYENQMVLVKGMETSRSATPRAATVSGQVLTSSVAQDVLSAEVIEAGRRVKPAAFDGVKEVLVSVSSLEKSFVGGGIFDESGLLLGMVTHGLTSASGQNFYRVLKSSFIAERLKAVKFPEKIQPIMEVINAPASLPEHCEDILIFKEAA